MIYSQWVTYGDLNKNLMIFFNSIVAMSMDLRFIVLFEIDEFDPLILSNHFFTYSGIFWTQCVYLIVESECTNACLVFFSRLVTPQGVHRQPIYIYYTETNKVYFKVYTVQCTLYTVQCTLYTVHYKLYIESTLYCLID